MSYADVDVAIRSWAAKYRLDLLVDSAGGEARFCYIGGGQQECFQVSIERPDDGLVVVHAWDVETIDDAELHQSWSVSTEAIDEALENAVGTIHVWKTREKGPATWSPPADW